MIIITGSGGLIGSSCTELFLKKKYDVIGVDNNFREKFFGKDANVRSSIRHLSKNKNYFHYNLDITSYEGLKKIFKKYKSKISFIIHCAAQPSHDFAKNNLFLDFNVNTVGTLNILKLFSEYCPESKFLFLSTNKVYGDAINNEIYLEKNNRFEPKNKYLKKFGVSENYPIDMSTHSYFGCSKLSADLYVQEFGRNNKLDTTILRGGCLTGPSHKGAELHGFLSYLIKCHVHNLKYKIYGYSGKQVRDNIHSSDMSELIYTIYKSKKNYGEVFNIGGGTQNNCSILEAIQILEEISKKKFDYSISKINRTGDHKWWITNLNKINKNYPGWSQKYSIFETIREIYLNESKKI